MSQVYNMDFCLINTAVKTDATIANGYKVYFYENDGTYTTQKDVYTDAGKSATHTQPVQYNANGFPADASDVFGQGMYDLKIFNEDASDDQDTGNLIRSRRNIGLAFSSGTTQSPNLVCNYSFETDADTDNVPDEWTFTGSNGARITTDQQHGAACVKFTGSSLGADSIESCFIPVSDNCVYEARCEYMVSNGNTDPKIVIYQYDDAQSALGTASQTIWNPATVTLSTSWTKTQWFRYDPTSGTKWVKISLVANANASSRDVYFDNVWFKEVDALPAATFLPNGLEISRDTDTDHDLNITAGSVLDDAGTYPLYLETEITKRGDAAWAIGDDAGGGDSGGSILPADALVYIWLIGDSDVGTTDVLFSLSATSPTLPSGWDKKRLIGAWRTDSSNNLIAGVHKGLYFWFFADILDINDSTVTHQTFADGTLTVPPNCIGIVGASVDINNAAFDDELYLELRPKGSSYSSFSFVAWVGMSQASANDTESIMRQGEIYVDASSQFEYGFGGDATMNAGDATIKVYMRGFVMLTRDNP